MKHILGLRIGVLLIAVLIGGCASKPPADQAAAPPAPRSSPRQAEEFNQHMTAARDHFGKRDWDAAIAECAAMFRIDPTNHDLQQLYSAIRSAQLKERAANLAELGQLSQKQMQLEAKEKEIIPPSYGVRKPVETAPNKIRTEETPMEKSLKKAISMDLEDAELSAILGELSKKAGIQFISDQSLIANKRITVRVENTPLKEIIDYLSRNLSVSFFAGENLLWVTASGAQQQALQPMETRIYRLRKGVNLPEAELIETEQLSAVSGQSTRRSPVRPRSMQGGAPAIPGQGGNGTATLEDIIDLFIEKPPGSNMVFHRSAHVLIVRNTRENLRLLEDIIEALDVTPRQVLIEARFIEVGINDLRELGIEWALNSDLATSTRAPGRPETVIRSGSGTSFPAPAPTPGGFNLTYTGVLTDPMFQAVLHALETSGKSRTLAVPRVTTVNNRAAKIRFGEDFRYFENFQAQSVLASTTGVGGAPIYVTQLVPVGTPTLEELGIQLVVLPSVGSDSDLISLTLAPQNKDFVRFENFPLGATFGASGTVGSSTSGTITQGSIKLPIFNVSEVTTRVVVHSGETVVLGGLVRNTVLRDVSKMPILGDLPFLGHFFRRSADTEKRSNLLIFVTATLISYSGESLVPVR